MTADPRASMLAIAGAGGDVGEAALWLAAEDCEGVVDVPACLALLDELGGELVARRGSAPPVMTAPVVAQLLADRLCLRGTGGADARAHYLHEVLRTGAGIPIACSAIWIAVGRRAGVDVCGIGLPGHFVVRVQGVLVDAHAGGEVLDDRGVRRLLAGVFGSEPAGIDPRWLEPASTRDMSRNLRSCHAAARDWTLALRAADRCVALLPGSPAERRDRGLLLWRAGHALPALADLRAYLESAPDAPDRAAVTEAVTRLRSSLN